MSDHKEETLWKNSIFVFDSSALLDFYFLPKSKRSEIFTDVLEKIKNRLWIPSQVEYEYLKNRESVISKPISEKYEPLKNIVKSIINNYEKEIINKIIAIQNATKNGDKHPHLNQENIDDFITKSNEFKNNINLSSNLILKDIQEAEKNIEECKADDDVFNAINTYFNVGDEISFEEIIKIVEEGKLRYEFKIPPGYGDFDSGQKIGTQIFADLIIWKQILTFSKEEKRPIIFILNDIKKGNDWCYLDDKPHDDRIKAPREELIKEIKDYSGIDFWMYNLPQFLYYANKYLKSQIEEDVIKNLTTNIQKNIEEEEEEEEEIDENLMIFINDLNRKSTTKKIDLQLVEDTLQKLTPREADILRLNSPHFTGYPMDIQEIAETFDISEYFIRKMRRTAVQKLLKN
ncbi:PIN-like domain-containing protein [Chryseobacterium sp. GVT01B]|uniref:PIN-like domain-containing protein n=1 Tax=Chryseobacterium sp. GVT01B TaxID=2862675 RepID=UPI001CBAD4DB|nr:PIN-like domain-containing protein [Chryseobacterium sp. GVT01B]